MEQLPSELKEWTPSITKHGLAFMAPDNIDKQKAIEIFQSIEDYLQGLADNGWTEVRLVWRGAKQGLRKFAISNQGLGFESSEEKEKTEDKPILTVPYHLPGVPESEIITEILGYDGGSCCLLRMSDDSPLFSNKNTESTSGIKANDWIKVKDHSPWWLGTELSDYKSRLLRDGSVQNYSYAARFIGAGGQIHQFTVSTRLVEYRDDICRLVKNISCVSIEL